MVIELRKSKIRPRKNQGSQASGPRTEARRGKVIKAVTLSTQRSCVTSLGVSGTSRTEGKMICGVEDSPSHAGDVL